MIDPVTEAARDLRVLSVTSGFDRLFIDAVCHSRAVAPEAVVARYRSLYREAPEVCARLDLGGARGRQALLPGISISRKGETQYFGQRFVLDGEAYVLASRLWGRGAEAFGSRDGRLYRFSEAQWARARLDLQPPSLRAG